MFGLIYGLFSLFGAGCENLRRRRENKAGKQRGIERKIRGVNNKNIYFDWQGHERDLTTDKKVMFYFDENHHYVEKEVCGPVIRDFTQEKLENRIKYEASKINGNQIILYHDWHRIHKMWDEKYNKGVPDYKYKRIPLGWDIDVYVHCKTNKLCIINCLDIDYYKNAYRNALIEYTGYNICKSFDLIIDLQTGLVIDVNHNTFNKGIAYYIDKQKIQTKLLTRNEEIECIDYLNKQIINKLLPVIDSPLKILF